jgi:NhaP-type Na+/H+ or K+/H+ antiporter
LCLAWIGGPRGLSSLLPILLPVFAGVPGSDRLFMITCLVVLLSVAIHGTAIAVFLQKTEGSSGGAPQATEARVTTQPEPDAGVPERITLDEMKQLRAAGEPVIIADVRTDRSYQADNLKAAGSIRLPPDGAVSRAASWGSTDERRSFFYCA